MHQQALTAAVAFISQLETDVAAASSYMVTRLDVKNSYWVIFLAVILLFSVIEQNVTFLNQWGFVLWSRKFYEFYFDNLTGLKTQSKPVCKISEPAKGTSTCINLQLITIFIRFTVVFVFVIVSSCTLCMLVLLYCQRFKINICLVNQCQ